MIHIDEAHQIIRDTLKDRSCGVETIPIHQSVGRTLAQNVHALIDIPPFHKSAMDGFAVMDDAPGYHILRTIPAGFSETVSLIPGSCVRIMTGAPVPGNAIRVIPIEHVEITGEFIRETHFSKNKNISLQGEDIRSGEIIGKTGDQIDCMKYAVLISCGIESVPVFRKISAAVFSTGDELVDRMSDWGPGKIFDSNGPLLSQLLKNYRADVRLRQRLSDDLDGTVDVFRHAANEYDLICLSGGVSAGDFDFIPQALTTAGFQIHFSRVCVKPGKPLTFATRERTVVIGFPGNPVSTYFTFHLFGIPILRRLHQQPILPRFVSIPIAAPYHRRMAQRPEFVPCQLTECGKLEVLPYHGSAHQSALLDMDGFMMIPQGITQLQPGESVSFWPVNTRSYHQQEL